MKRKTMWSPLPPPPCPPIFIYYVCRHAAIFFFFFLGWSKFWWLTVFWVWNARGWRSRHLQPLKWWNEMNIVDDNYKKWRSRKWSHISMYMCKSLVDPNVLMYGRTVNNPAKEKEREREKMTRKRKEGKEGQNWDVSFCKRHRLFSLCITKLIVS